MSMDIQILFLLLSTEVQAQLTFASSDRMALPSAMVSNSTAKYLAFMSSSSLFALTQKGHRVQLKTTTYNRQVSISPLLLQGECSLSGYTVIGAYRIVPNIRIHFATHCLLIVLPCLSRSDCLFNGVRRGEICDCNRYLIDQAIRE